jgi:hypothetical protein
MRSPGMPPVLKGKMKNKIPALCFLVLLLSTYLPAEPAIHHKKAKTIALALVTAGISAWQIKASHDCRARTDIKNCFGDYGSRKAMVGFVIGGQAAGAALSLWALHEDNPAWWVPAGISNGIFGINAIKQMQQPATVDVEAAHASALRYQLR